MITLVSDEPEITWLVALSDTLRKGVGDFISNDNLESITSLSISPKGVGEHTIVNLSIFMVYLVFDCDSVLYMDILILVDDISCPKT